MVKPKIVVLIGIILLVGGIVGGILSIFGTIKDPSEEAVETLTFEYSLYGTSPQTISLDKGEYDVWCASGLFGYGIPSDLTVEDSSGNVVYDGPGSSGESITINDQEYAKLGSFDADSSGSYTVSTDDSCTLYITEPISIGSTLGLCLAGVIIGIIGGIVLLIGIIMVVRSKKQPVQQYQQPAYPQQQPAYPQQQPAYPQQPQQPAYQQPPPPQYPQQQPQYQQPPQPPQYGQPPRPPGY